MKITQDDIEALQLIAVISECCGKVARNAVFSAMDFSQIEFPSAEAKHALETAQEQARVVREYTAMSGHTSDLADDLERVEHHMLTAIEAYRVISREWRKSFAA